MPGGGSNYIFLSFGAAGGALARPNLNRCPAGA